MRFEGYGPSAYVKKNKDKPVEDLVDKINKREGTETEHPSQLGKNKNLTRREREREARRNDM